MTQNEQQVKHRITSQNTAKKDGKEDPRHDLEPKKSKKWKLFAFLPLLMCLAAVYFLSNRSTEEIFVSARDTVTRAVLEVPCSHDYDNEEFQSCKPKRCARVVMDNIISKDDAKHLLGVAQKCLQLGGSSGGASILDLHSGALSMGNAFVSIYRLLKSENLNLLQEEDFRIYKKVKDQIHAAIATEFDIPKKSLYLTKPTFFSRMNMTLPKTIHDEYWHPHIDKNTYGSFHYTSLLYLTTYGEDFTGGRFVFIDKEKNKTVEPKLGRVSFFTSGSENVHFVERLKDGVRYAITVSFTCDPKQAIPDPESK